jgi:uncharacterized protein YebE (UPF0316 family)
MFYESDMFNWVILPMLIFLARVVDVSLGTLRIISLSKGLRRIAPVLGFIEILIWLFAIRQIFNHLNNPMCYVGYAGGFATGIFVGMTIEQKLAMGLRVIRVITRKDASHLIENLRNAGFGVTVTEAEGNTGKVKIIFTVVKRSDIQDVLFKVKQFNPKAFYSVEDVRAASEGIFPNNSKIFSKFLAFEKKGK